MHFCKVLLGEDQVFVLCISPELQVTNGVRLHWVYRSTSLPDLNGKRGNTENPRLSNYPTKAFQWVSRLWDLAAIVCIWSLREFTNPWEPTIFAKTTRLWGHLVWFIWPQWPEEAYVIAYCLSLILVISLWSLTNIYHPLPCRRCRAGHFK